MLIGDAFKELSLLIVPMIYKAFIFTSAFLLTKSNLPLSDDMNGINKNLQNIFCDPQSYQQLIAVCEQIKELNDVGERIVCPEQSHLIEEGHHFWKSEYHKLLALNKELEKETDELRGHLLEHQHVVEEIRILKIAVSNLSLTCQSIKSERDEYWGKTANLEPLNKCMREAAEKRKELEREYQETQALLKEKEAEITQLQKYEAAGKKKSKEETDVLQAQSQMRELKKLGELQAVKMEEITLELTSLQRQAVRSKSFATVTSEVQTSPESGTSTPDSSLGLSGSVRLVNGDVGGAKQTTSKSRMVNHKNDSGLGSSLDESISSRKDQITATRPRHQLAHHPLAESVDRALDSNSRLIEKNPVVSVFVTRFAYIPAKHSPNDATLDQELELKKGEFVIVYGDMDEDGFYEGETLDGRRGYVPSNLVERLPQHELIDFYASYPNNPLTSFSTSAGTFGTISQQQPPSIRFSQLRRPASNDNSAIKSDLPLTSVRPSDFSQKLSSYLGGRRDDVNEDPGIPAPRNLVVDRQMHKSIMIGWMPALAPPEFVESYNIYVDGCLRNSVRANERCRALIEGIDLNVCHRISIRSCIASGKESMDTLCTIMVGKNCPVIPDDQKIINVTSSAATITWRPANSSFQHCIYLNDKEYATVPASHTRFTIPELTPSTVYRVRVVPVPPNSTLAYSSYVLACPAVEFKTLPDNVPDPPESLQLESGPQDGTLLLSWTPVVPQANCDVTGYAIYADGQKVHQIDSPTGDHTVLDITRFPPPLPRNISVRTMSSKAQSRDSPFLTISEEVLLGQIKAVAQSQNNQPFSQPQIHQSQSQNQPVSSTMMQSQTAGNMSLSGPFNRQNTVTFREPQNRPLQPNIPRPPPEFFMGDELPDIQEELEEEGGMRRPPFAFRMPPFRGNMRNPNQPFMREPEMRGQGPPLFRPDLRPMDFEREGPPTMHRNIPEFQFPVKRFDNLSMGPPQERRFQPGAPIGHNRYRPGPIPGGLDRRSDFVRRPQSRGDMFPGSYDEEDYLSDPRDRFPEGANYFFQSRTSSLPQIEITKDDSFESMDSRHRAFSDRDTDGRSGYRGPRSRFNSPPNDTAYRRQRSQSRDRLDDGPRRAGRDINHFEDYPGERRPGRVATDRGGPIRMGNAMGMGHRSPGGPGSRKPDMDRPGSTATLQKAKNQVTKVFRAIFDHDSHHLPNMDDPTGELSFKHGELGYGEKHPEGWHSGDVHGRQGQIPGNMVNEVTDEHGVRSAFGRDNSMQKSKPSALKNPSNSQPQPAVLPSSRSRPSKGLVKKMVALYDYDNKTSLNPDPELELSFKEGDIIWVSGEVDDDGFYRGELNGKGGLVPSNFLADIPSSSSTNPPSRPRGESRSQSQSREDAQFRSKPSSAREPLHEVSSTSRGQTRDGRNLPGNYSGNPHSNPSVGQLNPPKH